MAAMPDAPDEPDTDPDVDTDDDTDDDVADLTYEQARDELVALVARLEGGQVPLEESMRLWRRGEALAAHCSAWLDRAEEGLNRAERDDTTDTKGP